MEWSAGPGVRLRLHARPDDRPRQFRVSLYLVNNTVPRDSWKTATDEFVFQPQLRVLCVDGTAVVPLPGGLTDEAGKSRSLEDSSLALLYRNRRPLARGHLCGAVWRDIDPQRPHPELSAPQEAPFLWTDGESLTTNERAKFTLPDVRSEFVPCYPIEAP
ncbi:MAG: hypothetical protein KGJ86_12940, partial [Chloroflexota bacterium]|nr:hypothetical protein [Chloroflexota bacterium]